ncbi:MAG: aminopeptidase P family N-terminal domain-containing protein [Dethiobacteria bacterium]
MRYTPKSEVVRRIAKLQEGMRQNGIEGAIIVQNADLFYFTGTIQNSHLFIPSEGQPLLMVKKNLERAIEESPLENIIGVSSMKEIYTALQSRGFGPFKLWVLNWMYCLQTCIYVINNYLSPLQ